MCQTESELRKEQLIQETGEWLDTHLHHSNDLERRAYYAIYNCNILAKDMITVKGLKAVKEIFNIFRYTY